MVAGRRPRCEHSFEPPTAPSWLAPDQGYELGPGVRQQEHTGATEIQVPPGAWTWLRALARGGAAYLRVAPSLSDEERELRIAAQQRTIHAFVLEADFRTPARGKEVGLWRASPYQPGQPSAVSTARTDAYGYARFAELAPDGYLLAAEGAVPEDPPPHAMRVLLLPAMPLTEMVCTLVLPEDRRLVRLDIQAELGSRDLDPVKLFFERCTGREGELYPVPDTVGPGSRSVELRLPLGEYRLEVLPLGCLVAQNLGERQVIGAGTGPLGIPVRLRPNPHETEITLFGFAPSDLPVTVFPRPVGRPLPDDQGLLYVGPYRWHLAMQRVRTPPGLTRLVARGRHAAWIAREPMTLGGEALLKRSEKG